ncbi:MAG: TPM domain-containing protein [Nitrospiraceae bacterium]|nr:TPM domain-containing protein [Nitrospiraceae bacterium]
MDTNSNRRHEGDRRLRVAMCSVILAVCVFLCAGLVLALDVPKLTGYVNDYAGMISAQTKAEIEGKLQTFEQTDSTQVVILTVPSLQNDPIEDFGIRAGEAWKIGQKGKDNGVILIVSKEDRKMRIEVGRGLEGKLTDLMSGRIINQVIKPRFKAGDYDAGFLAGVSAIIDATRGEFKADNSRSERPPHYGNFSRFMSILIFAVVGLGVIGSISRPFGGISGAVGLPALVNSTLMPLGLGGFIGLGLLGLVAGLLLPALFSTGRGGFGGGGFYGGGGFGGGFGGGGGDLGGGGGFGGGGGDFGGGGASGGW